MDTPQPYRSTANDSVDVVYGDVTPHRKRFVDYRRPPVDDPDTVKPPLWPTFSAGSTPGESVVRVEQGCVVDISTKTGNCLAHWPVSNLVAMDGSLEKFTIAAGQCGYIKIIHREDGAVGSDAGDPVTFVVDADGLESSHYDPPVGDETGGSGGTYVYKLFQFNGLDADPQFTPFMCGTNIQHFHELPTFKKAGGDNDIFKEFDSAEGKFKTKGLTASGPDYSGADPTIEIVSEADQLKFRTKGGNLDIEVYSLSEDTNGNIIQSTSPEHRLCWRAGVYIAKVADGDPIPGHDGTKDTQAVCKWAGV